MDEKPTRPSFLIYKSFYKPIKNLSNEDKGKLFTAIYEHQTQDFDGSEQVIEPQIEMAFEFFKNQFELDNKKWEKRVEAQRANGKKGGRPKNSVEDDAPDEKPNEPKVTHGFLNNPTKPKKGEKEIEKEIEKGKEKLNINMANPRSALGFGIKNAESKKLLEKIWKDLPESWKNDSIIRKMYDEKKDEFISY
jgi:hypothetical protein